jgi:hypothetical protein
MMAETTTALSFMTHDNLESKTRTNEKYYSVSLPLGAVQILSVLAVLDIPEMAAVQHVWLF